MMCIKDKKTMLKYAYCIVRFPVTSFKSHLLHGIYLN